MIIVRYEKAGVIGLMDNAGHLILAQVREKQKGPTRKGKHAEKKGKKIALARLGTWVCYASVL